MIDAIEAGAKINANIPEDVDDILHYIKALNYGMKRVVADDFPISMRFVRELHGKLMDQARTTHSLTQAIFVRAKIGLVVLVLIMHDLFLHQ